MNLQQSSLPAPGTFDALEALGWRSPDRDLIEQLPVAVYACDAAGRILWFNSRAAELWGRSPRVGDDSELYCGSHKLFFDGRLISRELTPMAEVLRTGVPLRGVESRVERPDGTHVRAIVYITPIRDGDGVIAGAINCFHERGSGAPPDTVNARPNEWVEARDARLAATYEHVGAGIVEVDKDGRMLRVNQQLCDLTNYSAEELIGRTIFQETLPEDTEADRQQFLRQLSGEID